MTRPALSLVQLKKTGFLGPIGKPVFIFSHPVAQLLFSRRRIFDEFGRPVSRVVTGPEDTYFYGVYKLKSLTKEQAMTIPSSTDGEGAEESREDEKEAEQFATNADIAHESQNYVTSGDEHSGEIQTVETDVSVRFLSYLEIFTCWS